MSGYVPKAKVYKLVFEDPEFEGLEVRAKSVPTGQFLELTALADSTGESVTPEDMAAIEGLFSGFADALVSWNVEKEDGTAVPADLAGIKAQDFDFMFTVIMAWMDAIAGVAAPLGRTSNSGSAALEASIPMAPSSSDPQS